MKPVVLLSLNPSDSDDNDYILNLNLVPESLGRNVEKSIPLQSQQNWGRKSFGIFRLWMPCIYTTLQRIKEIHAGKKDGTVSLLHNSRSGATDIDAKTGLLTSIISQILDAFATSRIRCETLSSIVWHCSKKHTVELLYGIGNWNHELFIYSEKNNVRKHHTTKDICRVISQQMLYFSQHFADKLCLENACCVMFTDICCHLTDMTFLGVGNFSKHPLKKFANIIGM